MGKVLKIVHTVDPYQFVRLCDITSKFVTTFSFPRRKGDEFTVYGLHVNSDTVEWRKISNDDELVGHIDNCLINHHRSICLSFCCNMKKGTNNVEQIYKQRDEEKSFQILVGMASTDTMSAENDIVYLGKSAGQV